MAKRRDPKLEAYWRSQVRRHLRSGVSVREFCRGEGLVEHSFHSWRREIRNRDAEGEVASLPTGDDEGLQNRTDGCGASEALGCASALSRATGTAKTVEVEAAAGGPRFTELLLANDQATLQVDEVEVRLRGGSVIRFRGGCPVEVIERVIASLERNAC